MATGESGFGSPTLVPAAAYPDAGFGDPYDDSFNALARDTGFGSPYDPLLSSIAVDTTEVSVRGGSRVLIYGPFSRGRVYDVKLVNGVSEYDCFSGVNRLAGGLCWRKGVLTVYTPILPAAVYDIKLIIENNPFILVDAIKAVPAVHNAETYAMRKFFPAHFAVGDRTGYLDRYVSGSLSGLLDSLGSMFNELSGKPHTYVAADWAYGSDTLSVKSTLTFPAAGTLSVGRQLLRYTGKTDTTFTGISPLYVIVELLTAGTEVAHHDK